MISNLEYLHRILEKKLIKTFDIYFKTASNLWHSLTSKLKKLAYRRILIVFRSFYIISSRETRLRDPFCSAILSIISFIQPLPLRIAHPKKIYIFFFSDCTLRWLHRSIIEMGFNDQTMTMKSRLNAKLFVRLNRFFRNSQSVKNGSQFLWRASQRAVVICMRFLYPQCYFRIAHRRYRESSSFEPTLSWRPQLHRAQSRARPYYFSVANRSFSRPITYDGERASRQ